MAQEAAGWSPPDAQEILMANIPDGHAWYELRLPLKTLSYPVERWDEALGDAKAFKRVFKRAALFYCFKENGTLSAEQVW